MSVYALLRSVLQTGLFDPDLGFNRTGRPQHAIGSLAGLGLRPSAATNLPLRLSSSLTTECRRRTYGEPSSTARMAWGSLAVASQNL